MLPVGIAIMVASVAVGVIALTLVAVMSPAARSAGRRTRIAMALSDEEDAPVASRTREIAAPHRTTGADPPYYPEEEGTPYYRAGEDAPSYPPERDAPDYPPDPDTPDYPPEQDTPDYPPEQDTRHYPPEQDVRESPAEQDPSSYATEIADAPRWVIVSVIMSGLGLLIGLLMVMIASIP